MSRKRPLDEGVETTKRSNKGIKKKYIKTDESALRRGSGIVRCEWGDMSDAMRRYHDEEWGVFRDDDRFLFEMLTLEGAQAGLNWSTILNKRENYVKAFDGFDITKVAQYNTSKLDALKDDCGIVRNRLKIKSTVSNAKSVLEIQTEFGSFANYLWKIVNENREDEHCGNQERIAILSPDSTRIVSTPVSDAISKDMKRRGMSFCGTTIIYAYMQAVGLVNDHSLECFRRKEV